MLVLSAAIILGMMWSTHCKADELTNMTLQSSISHVQPMTGIVLWTDHPDVQTNSIQLEYRYCGYNEVVNGDGVYNFAVIDRILDEVASHNHQAILRFYFDYPGKKSTAPEFILKQPNYRETIGKSEGLNTHFCDWSNDLLQQFTLDFYSKLAERYDKDPRLAFLQTGFGLWAEYHIYDGPMKLGKTFPSKDFQNRFLQHMDSAFENLPWMISIDAADDECTPIAGDSKLLSLNFGAFDDSFLCKNHSKENAVNWSTIGSDRWKRAPAGGEFSYYNKRDQKLALSKTGPNGISFEKAAQQFHISFMIGNDQPSYQNKDRIAEAGMNTGYRFRVTSAKSDGQRLILNVINEGVAPLYRDAYFAIDDRRSDVSLKGLLPNESRTVKIQTSVKEIQDRLKIQCDAILPGQEIQYSASLTDG